MPLCQQTAESNYNHCLYQLVLHCSECDQGVCGMRGASVVAVHGQHGASRPVRHVLRFAALTARSEIISIYYLLHLTSSQSVRSRKLSNAQVGHRMGDRKLSQAPPFNWASNPHWARMVVRSSNVLSIRKACAPAINLLAATSQI
jgi:hypothetical protein